MLPPCDALRAARPRGDGLSLPSLPRLRTARCRGLVIVNTHLDEDICAAGGLIARVAARGAPIHVLAVTDSDGASAAHRHAAPPGDLNRRLANQRLAYERLGARHARHDALALRGGQVHDHRGDVLAALSEIIGFAAATSGLWVLAPQRDDPHPDHAAAGAAAAQACHAYQVRLIEYLPTGGRTASRFRKRPRAWCWARFWTSANATPSPPPWHAAHPRDWSWTRCTSPTASAPGRRAACGELTPPDRTGVGTPSGG
jgi:LmbE family N-acetylglucosaminyl deacetylase